MEQEFLNGLDALFAVNDGKAAGEYLLEWYKKAQEQDNLRLMITVQNEMLGFYRSVGDEKRAMDSVAQMMELLQKNGLSDSVEAGTVYINLGTTLCRFCHYEEGVRFYELAEERLKNCGDLFVLASLYNNSAAAREASGDAKAAIEQYKKSLELLRTRADGINFIAITYANMANCYGSIGMDSEMRECMEKMDAILESDEIVHDSGYASVCVKCASLHYNLGNRERCDELTERAENIYRGGIL